TRQHHTAGESAAVQFRLIEPQKRGKFLVHVVGGNQADLAIDVLPDVGDLGTAEPCGGFNDDVQYRLQVGGRTADDAENVAGRGLLLQRFHQLLRASLHFLKQADVLDGNHRLVGEGGDQLDLLVC